MTSTLQQIFDRDLKKLKKEILDYSDENNLWITEKEISNSAGHLCLHIVGNLNWFIGAQLGNTGYVRNRPMEFGSASVDRDKMLLEIDRTRSVIQQSLDQVTEEQLEADFPIQVFDKKTSTRYFLLHLTTHLAYHLGQINYHRRLLDA